MTDTAIDPDQLTKAIDEYDGTHSGNNYRLIVAAARAYRETLKNPPAPPPPALADTPELREAVDLLRRARWGPQYGPALRTILDAVEAALPKYAWRVWCYRVGAGERVTHNVPWDRVGELLEQAQKDGATSFGLLRQVAP